MNFADRLEICKDMIYNDNIMLMFLTFKSHYDSFRAFMQTINQDISLLPTESYI